MIKKKMTIKEATEHWVRGFNAISQSIIERAFKDDIDNWMELTKPTIGDYVWSNEHQGEHEVISINRKEEKAILDVDGEEKETDLNDITKEFDSWLPMWGTMWTFEERLDEDWARENPEILSECGFRVFEDQETGDIYIGIEGAGYSFYEQHWIPLYKARGLQWHDESITE